MGFLILIQCGSAVDLHKGYRRASPRCLPNPTDTHVGVRGASIQVLVGPTYFTVPIDEKKGFAEVVNCVLLKGAGGGIAFDLVHWQTGMRVASWNGYRLDVD